MHDEQIPCHNHEFGHFPDEIPHNHHCHRLHDCAADCCEDQLPIEASIGRGPQGDGFFVRILDPDDCTQTYLEGLSIDHATGELHSEWISDNINGGELSYQYNLRPFTIPQTFTITFIYRRPSGKGAMTGWKRTPPDEKDRLVDMSNYGNNDGKKPTDPRKECIGSSPAYGKELGQPDECSWSWTTPAIPYIWDVDNDGNPDADHVVGSGVATLFVRTDNYDHQEQVGDRGDIPDAKWNERLVYPPGTTRDDYNAPLPLEAWSANLTFGLLHGDVLVPNLYDLADILGWPANNLYNLVDGQDGQISGSDNVKDYIDDQFGFYDGDADLPGNDGDISAKDYMDWWFNFILNRISSPSDVFQLNFSQDQADQLYFDNPERNNWAHPRLGGSLLIYPSLGVMFMHFVYRTAVNNGTGSGGQNVPQAEDTVIPYEQNEAFIRLANLSDELSALTNKYEISDFFPKDKVTYNSLGRLTVTAGGGQPYMGSSNGVSSVDFTIHPDGKISLASSIKLSPISWVLLFQGDEGPHVGEWDITIEATTLIALNDKWNSNRPWEGKYLGYDDPFGHPSKPPKEMFADLWNVIKGV